MGLGMCWPSGKIEGTVGISAQDTQTLKQIISNTVKVHKEKKMKITFNECFTDIDTVFVLSARPPSNINTHPPLLECVSVDKHPNSVLVMMK